MPAATICRCGAIVAKNERHACAQLLEHKRTDQARRNARPITKARSTTAWRRTASQIRRRDGNRCQHCGTPDSGPRTLAVHHIGDGTDHRPANLITLCHRCHGRIDGPKAANTCLTTPR